MATVWDGPGNRDATLEPTELVKNGPGWGVASLKAGGYRVVMDGPGNLYLIGQQEYGAVVVRKNGPGHLVWVPKDPNSYNAGPTVEFHDGPGPIRYGTWQEIKQLRGIS